MDFPQAKEGLTQRKLMLKERGHIYSAKHEGWYSISDETFYPATAVHLTLDPSTGRKHMVSSAELHIYASNSCLSRHRQKRVKRLNGHLKKTTIFGSLLSEIDSLISI